jgi:hypothetical protein
VTAVKVAATVCGALIVTDVEAALELATLPLQPEKVNPLFGVAEIETTVPEL